MIKTYKKEREFYKDILDEGSTYAIAKINRDSIIDAWRQTNEVAGQKITNYWYARTKAHNIAHAHAGLRPICKSDQQLIFKEIVLSRRKDLVKKMVELALEGDTDMIRILSERGVLPAKQKDNYIDMDMNGTAKEISDRLMQGVGAGEILPSEGAKLMDMLRIATDMTTLQDISDKIDKLEKTLPT